MRPLIIELIINKMSEENHKQRLNELMLTVQRFWYFVDEFKSIHQVTENENDFYVHVVSDEKDSVVHMDGYEDAISSGQMSCVRLMSVYKTWRDEAVAAGRRLRAYSAFFNKPTDYSTSTFELHDESGISNIEELLSNNIDTKDHSIPLFVDPNVNIFKSRNDRYDDADLPQFYDMSSIDYTGHQIIDVDQYIINEQDIINHYLGSLSDAATIDVYTRSAWDRLQHMIDCAYHALSIGSEEPVIYNPGPIRLKILIDDTTSLDELKNDLDWCARVSLGVDCIMRPWTLDADKLAHDIRSHIKDHNIIVCFHK